MQIYVRHVNIHTGVDVLHRVDLLYGEVVCPTCGWRGPVNP